MSEYEYRAEPAPQRGIKVKGARSGRARFAAAIGAALNEAAASGWEFVRAETLPCEERSGLAGTKTVQHTLLIFRRPRDIDEAQATRAALRLLEDRDRGHDEAP